MHSLLELSEEMVLIFLKLPLNYFINLFFISQNEIRRIENLEVLPKLRYMLCLAFMSFARFIINLKLARNTLHIDKYRGVQQKTVDLTGFKVWSLNSEYFLH